MTKIIGVQREVLTKLIDGSVLLVYRSGGYWTTNTTPDVRPGCPAWSVTAQTVKAMQKRGWIERVATVVIYDVKYSITDAGRAAINEEGSK